MDSTFDGSYEPVQEINEALETLNRETSWQVPLHVDGASSCKNSFQMWKFPSCLNLEELHLIEDSNA